MNGSWHSFVLSPAGAITLPLLMKLALESSLNHSTGQNCTSAPCTWFTMSNLVPRPHYSNLDDYVRKWPLGTLCGWFLLWQLRDLFCSRFTDFLSSVYPLRQTTDKRNQSRFLSQLSVKLSASFRPVSQLSAPVRNSFRKWFKSHFSKTGETKSSSRLICCLTVEKVAALSTTVVFCDRGSTFLLH